MLAAGAGIAGRYRLAGAGQEMPRADDLLLSRLVLLTLVTALAFTVVVVLLMVMHAFATGIQRLSQGSGQPANVIVLSDGASDELYSNLPMSETSDLARQDGVLRDTFPDVDPARIHVRVVEMQPDLLGPFDKKLRDYTRDQLVKRGVDVQLNTAIADSIGLSGEAKAEKRLAFADPKHNRWAAAEVEAWGRTAEQARLAGPFDTELPVGVVLAGAPGPGTRWKAQLSAPALSARAGFVEHVRGASHATLLSPRFASCIVEVVEKVMAAGAAAPAQTRQTG